MMSGRLSIVMFVSVLLLAGCEKQPTETASLTSPPKSYLWLYPDSTVGTGVSKSHLHWWGEAPNSLVRGFLFSFAIVRGTVTSLPSPDTLRYDWTTKNDTTILFPLDTAFRRFAVVVRSVSYGFAGLPEHAVVRMLPTPYWDKNDNGVFDGQDQPLTDLPGAIDPVGAVQTFPIQNSPPTIALLPNLLDPTSVQKIPDTTYTAVTIGFKGSDPDGDNTLSSYRIALNDTSASAQWLTVSLRDTIVTLVVPRSRSDAAGSVAYADVYSGPFVPQKQPLGQLQGLRLDAENSITVESRDVAGEYSQPLTLPGSPTQHWYVKRPRGRLLLVSDYAGSDAATVLGTYLSALGNVPGGAYASVDRLDIAAGVTLGDKAVGKTGRLVPAYIDPELIQTFLLYDFVFWYTDQQPSLGIAQLSLFPYMQQNGKVLFSTSFVNTSDPRGALSDFAPIDSVSSIPLPAAPPQVGDTRIPANTIVYPDSSNAGLIFPLLAFDNSRVNHSIFMRPLYRRTDASYIYHLQSDAFSVVYHPGQPDSAVYRPARNNYLGTPNIGVIDGERQIIFIGVPLHLLDNTDLAGTNVELQSGRPRGLAAFFSTVFNTFNPSLTVNRRTY